MLESATDTAYANDGCPVALYRALPYLGELDEVLHMFPRGSVLELGCGTGRLCEKLRSAGLEVVGLDNSAEMLSHVPAGIETVLSDIETLSLERRFDCVLMAGQLVNQEHASMASAFLQAAFRHLKPRGILLLKRADRDWFLSASAGQSHMMHNLRLHVDQVERTDALIAMTLRYTSGDNAWTHTFRCRMLSEADVEQMLSAAGFSDFSWIGAKRTWIVATKPV